jgi:hypothetical protein
MGELTDFPRKAVFYLESIAGVAGGGERGE